MPLNEQEEFLITAVGDTTCSNDARSTIQNITNEAPHLNLFLGDSAYEHDATCFIDIFKSFNGLKEKTIFTRGNHDDKEDESDTVKVQLENYFGITDWTITKQLGNIYVIDMNSQDPEWDLKNKDQYNWVKNKLEESSKMRDNEGKIDWIIVLIHKPLYTLKGGHTPERKARDIYQPLFDQYQVDFVLHGHSHNMQRTLPIKYGGLDQEPTITSSGLDFSHEHGQIYIVSGAGGRMIRKFDEPKNSWTSFAYPDNDDNRFGYHLFRFKGRKADIFAKLNDGDVLEHFTVTK
jgi:predicted phosphodiesterase